MRVHIDNLVKGIFEYEIGKLNISEKKLELLLEPGGEARGSFYIESADDRIVRGSIFSFHTRMVCERITFEHNRVEIPYVFNGKGLEEGEVTKGEIHIVSEAGEYYLPFVASVSHNVLKSSVGNIKNLFHFTNLAQSDFSEAEKLFYSSEFTKILINNDRIYYNKYRGLSRRKDSGRNVEEFLVSIHKKSPVLFSVDKQVIECDNPKESTENEITIFKSTWGFVYLEAECNAGFIRLDKKLYTDDDFLGNRCKLSFIIDVEQLHQGTNYGRIRLISFQSTIDILVTVKNGTKGLMTRQLFMESQRLKADLMEIYLQFRTKKISSEVWVKKSNAIIEKMISYDENDIAARLFQAQLLLTEERYNEARWVLDHVENDVKMELKSPDMYGYFLYLTALQNREADYVAQVKKEVLELYAANRQNYRLLWILLYLDEEMNRNVARKMLMIEHQFERGCTSPLIYCEAYTIISEKPVLLTKIDEFELQVLYWAVKRGIYHDELAKQVVYLSGKAKRFVPLLHKILCFFYEEKEGEDVLSAICTHLIKGNMTEPIYFPWYEEAVNKELRITRLYDYYMYTIPMEYNDILPKQILLYFAYNSDLEYRRAAFLYAGILRHRDEMPEMLRSYERQMKEFVIAQINKEHMDKNLAIVYRYMIPYISMTEEMAHHIAHLMFSHRIACQDDRMQRVIAVHGQLNEETVVPLTNGEAYLNLYGNDYEIMFEDFQGNRFDASVEKSVEAMIRLSEYAVSISKVVTNDIGISLFLSEGRKHYIVVQEENAEHVRKIVDSGKVRESYKRELRKNLIQFYYDMDMIGELDSFLLSINIDDLKSTERAEIIEFFIRRAMYEEAYRAISVYGPEKISVKLLVKLCSRMISILDFEMDEMLLKLSYLVFRAGKYDQVVLKYLVDSFNGITKEMRNIWKAAVNFDIEDYRLTERIIIQMLYTRSFISEKENVFEAYQKGIANTAVELAYLSYNAYEYFVKDRVMDARIFLQILNQHQMGEELNDVCKLSVIRAFAEDGAIRDAMREYMGSVEEMLCGFIRDMLRRKVFFCFFMNYENQIPELEIYKDKTIVEYKTFPNSRVILHYVQERENEESVVYIKEEMKNMYGGIFSKEFVLFFGETLQYYITEEIRGKEFLTQSKVITKNDINMDGRESRYDMLNDITVSQTLQDDFSLLKLMEGYMKKKQLVDRIFQMK